MNTNSLVATIWNIEIDGKKISKRVYRKKYDERDDRLKLDLFDTEDHSDSYEDSIYEASESTESFHDDETVVETQEERKKGGFEEVAEIGEDVIISNHRND